MTMVWIFTMCHQDDLYAPGSPIRQLLMQAATLDVRRYFRPPGEVVIHGRQQKHISEVDWLLRFNARGISPGQLEEFVTIYRLRRSATWQYEHLAAIVNKWPLRLKEFYHYELKKRVDQLVYCHAQRCRQRSAVSKLSFFANPYEQVFILDSNSERAARRYFGRRFTQPKLVDFSKCMEQRLGRELACHDFGQALELVTPLLNPVREVLHASEDGLRNFAARRLLDKLMYYEGRLLDEHHRDPCGGAAQRVVSGWIRALQTDIAAADEANRRPDAAD